MRDEAGSGSGRVGIVSDAFGPPSLAWMRWWLIAAAVYNLIWGALTVLYPAWLFDLTGMEPPRYPFIWQCVGMIVGVYGVGYWCAARDPIRHWPIVLVGFLGKIFGPLGYVSGVVRGEVPAAFGVTLPTNDLIWWIPFALILWAAFRSHAGAGLVPAVDVHEVPSVEQALGEMKSSDGRSITMHSREHPVLLVFLRHAGCTFCKEALADLRARRTTLDRSGVRLALVHMDPNDDAAQKFIAGYGLDDAMVISDPARRFYQAFELRRGSFAQLFGVKSIVRGAAATLRGHRVGQLVGDGFQMPGVFLIRDGQVIRSFRHRSAADRPDYAALSCAAGGPA